MDPRTARRRASRRRGSVRLDPVQRVSIRPIDEFDRTALSDFYAGLSEASTHRRFLSWSRPLPADIDPLARTPWVVGILVAPGDRDGAIVGHAVFCPDGAGSVEIAFAVSDELHGRGVGRALVAATIEEAQRTGVTRLTATTLPENGAMRHLMLDAGCRIQADRLVAGVEEIELGVVSAASPAGALAR